MGIFDFLGSILKPVKDIADEFHHSGEEKNKFALAIKTMEGAFREKFIEYETKLLESKSAVIVAEAQSDSALTRMWRPTIMLMFGFIVFWNHIIAPIFGATFLPVPEQLWTLMTIGLGGYLGGRSLEKIVPASIKLLKK